MTTPPSNPTTQHHLTDVIARACAKDARAWRELVRRFSPLVYSIPRRYGLSGEECDDVFQAVFIILLRELPSIKEPKTLPKWLMTTTHRECWRVARSRSRRLVLEASELPEAMEPPPQQVIRWEREHRVRAALTELGGRCQRLIEALFLDPSHPDYEAISRRLGIPPGSIGPTRSRCLAKLAELLEDLE